MGSGDKAGLSDFKGNCGLSVSCTRRTDSTMPCPGGYLARTALSRTDLNSVDALPEKTWDEIRAEVREVNMHSLSWSYRIFSNNFRTQDICTTCDSAWHSHAQTLTHTGIQVCTGHKTSAYREPICHIMLDCIGRPLTEEEVKCISSEDR